MRQRLLRSIHSVRHPHLAHHRRIATSTVNAGDVGSATYDQRGLTKARSLIDDVLPRSRFGSSIFTTPLLLFFRLFYQATSFDSETAPSAISAPRRTIRRLYRKASAALRKSKSAGPTDSLDIFKSNGNPDLVSKASTDAWHSLLESEEHPISPNSTLQSMTWVKSLSAPLSHEYLQFVIVCSESGKRYRLVTERDADGDWAYFIASSETCGTSQLSGKITQLRQYDYQHDLPLPLLSVSWSRLLHRERPTAAQLAIVLEHTSKHNPGYNVTREHCWWYAEAVFEQMFESSSNKLRSVGQRESACTEYGQPCLRHWPAGAYRYSYVVLGKRVMRRELLIEQARSFRKAMDQDGHLRW